MNTPTKFSQFIYGKFVGKNAGYQLVAHTADPSLPSVEEMTSMVEKTHHFWAHPPTGERKAVGICSYGEQVLLMQAAPAVNEQNQLVPSGGSPFDQHRYVFIPRQALENLHHQTLLLLSWLFNQPIPLMSEFDSNLPPLAVPLLEGQTISGQEKTKQVQNCWNSLVGQKLLLPALDALLQGQRLLLTRQDEIPPESFLESLILLLPSICRSQVAIAVGTLDEHHCSWANIIAKTNGSPQHRLNSDLLEVSLKNNKLLSNPSQSVCAHSYTHEIVEAIISSSESQSEKIAALLQALEHVNDKALTLENLSSAEAIAYFIPQLTHEKRISYWSKCLEDDKVDWEKLLSSVGHEQSLLDLWQILSRPESKSVKKDCALLLPVWRLLSPKTQINLLQTDLQQNLQLAEILLESGLLDYLDVQNQAVGLILPDLEKLCCSVIQFIATQYGYEKALQLAENLAHHEVFSDRIETFFLADAAIPNSLSQEKVWSFFHHQIAPQLASLPFEQLKISRFHQQLSACNPIATRLLSQLFEQNQNTAKPSDLLELAKLMHVPEALLIENYLEKWNPHYEEMKCLLTALIKRDVQQFQQFRWQAIPEIYDWFEQQEPKIGTLLIALEQQPEQWENWQNIAQELQSDIKQQILFVNSLVGQKFRVEILRIWLGLATSSPTEQQPLLREFNWQLLNAGELNQLVPTLTIEQLQTLALCLCQSARFDLIPGHLLHHLHRAWLQQQCIIPTELQTALSSPNLKYSGEDWQKLKQLDWQLGTQFDLRPASVTAQELKTFCLSTLSNLEQFEQAERLLSDCHAWDFSPADFNQILLQLVPLCAQVGHTIQLIQACDRFGFTPSQQQEILRRVDPQYCNARLVLSLLEKSFGSEPNYDLLTLLLKLLLSDPQDIVQAENYLSQALAYLINRREKPEMLQNWSSLLTNRGIYLTSFTGATQQVITVANVAKDATELLSYAQALRHPHLCKEEYNILQAAIRMQIEQLLNPLV